MPFLWYSEFQDYPVTNIYFVSDKWRSWYVEFQSHSIGNIYANPESKSAPITLSVLYYGIRNVKTSVYFIIQKWRGSVTHSQPAIRDHRSMPLVTTGYIGYHRYWLFGIRPCCVTVLSTDSSWTTTCIVLAWVPVREENRLQARIVGEEVVRVPVYLDSSCNVKYTIIVLSWISSWHGRMPGVCGFGLTGLHFTVKL